MVDPPEFPYKPGPHASSQTWGLLLPSTPLQPAALVSHHASIHPPIPPSLRPANMSRTTGNRDDIPAKAMEDPQLRASSAAGAPEETIASGLTNTDRNKGELVASGSATVLAHPRGKALVVAGNFEGALTLKVPKVEARAELVQIVISPNANTWRKCLSLPSEWHYHFLSVHCPLTQSAPATAAMSYLWVPMTARIAKILLAYMVQNSISYGAIRFIYPNRERVLLTEKATVAEVRAFLR